MIMRLIRLIILLFLFSVNSGICQLNSIDYMTPKEYTIAGIVVDGIRNLDHNLIIQKSDFRRNRAAMAPVSLLSTRGMLGLMLTE